MGGVDEEPRAGKVAVAMQRWRASRKAEMMGGVGAMTPREREKGAVRLPNGLAGGGGFDRTCVVCLDDFDPDPTSSDVEAEQTIRTLSCFHRFHAPCIHAYQSHHGLATCPLCQLNIGRAGDRVQAPAAAHLGRNVRFC